MEQSELVLIVRRASATGGLRDGERFKISEPSVVGRSPDADLWLQDPTISRVHARFAQSPEGRWGLENLSRGNGVFIEGQPIQPGERVVLSDERVQVQLGGVLLTVHVLVSTVPVLEPMAPVHEKEKFLRLVRDGQSCTVFCKGRFVPMKPSSALALYALAQRPGEVLHAWDMQQVMGTGYHLPQAISGVRRALRGLLEEGWLDHSELCALIRAASCGEHTQGLVNLSAAAL
ncbi:MAG: FHA domain-containing protein, partial [Myxococcota bacterium]